MIGLFDLFMSAVIRQEKEERRIEMKKGMQKETELVRINCTLLMIEALLIWLPEHRKSKDAPSVHLAQRTITCLRELQEILEIRRERLNDE